MFVSMVVLGMKMSVGFGNVDDVIIMLTVSFVNAINSPSVENSVRNHITSHVQTKSSVISFLDEYRQRIDFYHFTISGI